MNKINISKQVYVIKKYNVVVAGGGPSGFIAAVAAAKMGASVALIERYGYLGGMATAGMVAPISEFMHEGELICKGLPLEFVNSIEGGKMCAPRGNYVYHPEQYKLAAQRMVLGSGVDLYLHAYVTDIVKNENGSITHVVFDSKSGTQALEAQYVIDATGDGDIAYMAGVPMQSYGTPLQPASMYFALRNVDTSEFSGYYPGDKHSSLPWIRELLSKIDGAPQMGGPWCFAGMGEGTAVINMSRTAANWTDERDATAAECRLREDINVLVKLLRQNIPAFKNAELMMTSPQMGVRETRHILGTHVLTGEEYVNGVHFADSVARCAHPIDIHATQGNTQVVKHLNQAAYLPYRSIIANGYPNLLVPSRCFSADREAFASARVQVGVMGLGQAAGVAAALCSQQNASVHDANINELRSILIDWGMDI